jgi:type II secretory pathway pseudopilin PulG
MKIYCHKKTQTGMTIAEVVVAIAIMAIMGAAIIASFNYGFLVMGLARENQRATQVLLEKAETIRLFSWDQVQGASTNGLIPSSFSEKYDPQAETGNQGVTYWGTLAITNCPFTTSYSDNMKQLIITLSWTNGYGSLVRTRSLATLVAKDGLQNYVY